MNDLLVECPIHLDAVPIQDILVFRCGHGFCEPCLKEHFSHHGPSRLLCPTCRNPVRRAEAFPLFLAAPQPRATQSSHSTAETSHTQLIRELKEARAAHANCPGRSIELQREIDTLRHDGALDNQTIQLLRGRYELLEERVAKESDNSARAREESNRMKEEMAKLQVENHKISKALEQALKEVQVQLERVKLFQGYIKQYKHKCNLERKKRKAVENVNRHVPHREDDSLMIVDANAPDMLHQDGPNLGWLDEACKVKGDRITIPGDEDSELELESEDEIRLSGLDTNGKQTEDRPGVSLRFPSDWNLRPEALGGPTPGVTRKRGHGSKQEGETKLIRVKMPVAAGARHLVGGPLAIDKQGLSSLAPGKSLIQRIEIHAGHSGGRAVTHTYST